AAARDRARGHYLHAAAYYGAALAGVARSTEPERAADLWRRQRGCGDRAAARFPVPAQRLAIPYAAGTLPAYFFPAPDARPGEPRPTVIVNNDVYGATSLAWVRGGAAAAARGHHWLTFDGPGQQAARVEQGLRARPDWEAVLTPVVDAVVARPDVDAARVAVLGAGEAGYLVARALAFEHRPVAAALVPGVVDLGAAWRAALPAGMRDRLRRGDGTAFDAEVRLAGLFRPEVVSALRAYAAPYQEDGGGDASPASLYARLERFRLGDEVARIRTPLLVVEDERCGWPGQARLLFDRLPGGGDGDGDGHALLCCDDAVERDDRVSARGSPPGLRSGRRQCRSPLLKSVGAGGGKLAVFPTSLSPQEFNMFTLPPSSKFLITGLAVASLSGAALAGTAGTALADGGGTTPFIQHWSAFSGGTVGGYTVGDPIQVHYLDPSGQTTEKQFCWSPAPIGEPACNTTGVGAPAQAGTQTVTAELNNGQSVRTQFSVGAANTVLGSGTGPFTPPVLYTVNGSIALSADARLSQVIGQVSVGQQVAGYYSPRSGVTQVYDYATNQSGFMPSVLLTGPTPQLQTYTKVAKLKSNRTMTYTLMLPAGFDAGTGTGNGTPVDYSLYRGSAVGTGVGAGISNTGKGNHQPFLGATITRSSYNGKSVSVTVKTTKLSGPLTLRIAAMGGVS
ncbi:MAG TPA: hypothetical protein VI318_00020, partial [Baekduia sp.]